VHRFGVNLGIYGHHKVFDAFDVIAIKAFFHIAVLINDEVKLTNEKLAMPGRDVKELRMQSAHMLMKSCNHFGPAQEVTLFFVKGDGFVVDYHGLCPSKVKPLKERRGY
jgi:hypothetical protein